MANLGVGYARAGQRKEAVRILDLLRSEMKGQFVDEFTLATVYVQLGDKEACFRSLEKAVQQRSFNLLSLRTEPTMEGIRGDPRYQALLKKVGLVD